MITQDYLEIVLVLFSLWIWVAIYYITKTKFNIVPKEKKILILATLAIVHITIIATLTYLWKY